jgi:hypothetical protein
LLAVTLSACTPGTTAIVDSVRNVVPREAGVADSARLNPQFRYLRVTVAGQTALLVLGYVDAHSQGPIEVWYSGLREVLRLQNGRIAGALGLTTEWRSVEAVSPVPSWTSVARAAGPVSWTRLRDVMPGYRYGVRDSLSLRRIAALQNSSLKGLDPAGLVWFEERLEGDPGEDTWLPPARFAVQIRDGRETVVYSEQCISRDLCFTWQRWPAGTQAVSGN